MICRDTPTHGWVCQWMGGSVGQWVGSCQTLKSNKSLPDRDNSIMDILDILLDILLKPPQPFIGLFF